MTKTKLKRVGILTGGGDCPGLNAVIRAVAKTLIGRGIEIVGIKDGFLGLVMDHHIKLNDKSVSNILTLGGTILGSSNKDNPFEFYVKKGKTTVKTDCSGQALEVYRSHNLDALVCLGGDGTMSIANKLSKLGMNIVGIPKTIDNDLLQTDRTFGFDTAVAVVSDALDRLHTTAASHHRCMVVETMGRYAGWIALHAGVASGGDIILIPEISFTLDKIYEVVHSRYNRGKQFTIIVAAEGAYPSGGKVFVDKTIPTSHDPIRLGGIAKYVADEVEKATGVESRAIVLGHVQRGGTPTPDDRALATLYGCHAADMVLKRKFNHMVCLQKGEVKEVSLESVADRIRNVPLDYPLLCAARALGTSFGD